MESYVTPILLSYVDKYVRDFRPADAQVSLWSGGVTLHNLVLKPDVLQREVALPFTLVSGRIHELHIDVPWTSITTQPISVNINTIECVLSLNPPEDEEAVVHSNQLVPSPPRYLRSLIRRVVSNISVTIQSLIVKYVHDDIVLSLNVKWLHIDSADADWNPAFTDIDPDELLVRRLVRLDDFTLCLDRSEGDGRILHYQEPLLDRCQLDIRVLTSLISLQNRKAKDLYLEIRSNKLELGVTSDQLLLLLRLLRERPPPAPPRPHQPPPPAPKPSASDDLPPMGSASFGTWTEWAWSWLPSLTDRGEGEAPVEAQPFPILVQAFLDKIVFIFKAMETEAGTGRRIARPLLELDASHLVVRHLQAVPTMTHLDVAVRALQLVSRGKCLCGYSDLQTLQDKPTVYLVSDNPMVSSYTWPEEEIKKTVVQTVYTEAMTPSELPRGLRHVAVAEDGTDAEDEDDKSFREHVERPWFGMLPFLHIEFEHDRDTQGDQCPYENPPEDFEYSDWIEAQATRVSVRPLTVNVRAGLIHRLEYLLDVLKDLPPVVVPDMVAPPLTEEECDALLGNLPKRTVTAWMRHLKFNFMPWDHVVGEQPTEPPAMFKLFIGFVQLDAKAPLHQKRVCMAAGDIPIILHPIRKAAYTKYMMQVDCCWAVVSSLRGQLPKHMFDGTFIILGKFLPYQKLFSRRIAILDKFEAQAPFMTTYVTPAAFKVAVEIFESLYKRRVSTMLKDTTLPDDAIKMENTVAVDSDINRLSLKMIAYSNIWLTQIQLYFLKSSAVEVKNGEEDNIGWVISAPDYEFNNTRPCFKMMIQLCRNDPIDVAEYVHIDTDSAAINFEPLFTRWLSYRPRAKPQPKPSSKSGSVKPTPSSKYFTRRRGTPPASTVRGSRAGSATEFVHGRTRSAESVSERREPPPEQPCTSASLKVDDRLWDGEKLVRMYERMRRTLVSVTMGSLLVYNTSSTTHARPNNHLPPNRRAKELHRVLVVCLGKWVLTTSKHHLWGNIYEGALSNQPARLLLDQTFPWKVEITGMSSYTVEASPPAKLTQEDRDNVRCLSRSPTVVDPVPRTMLRLMDSSIIISVITKTADKLPMPQPKPKRPPPPSTEDTKKKYFVGGMDYRPTTLMDYIRGPGRRPGSSDPNPNPPDSPSNRPQRPEGPIVYLALHVHVDAPPITIDVTQDQVHTIRAAFHNLSHMAALLRRPNPLVPQPPSRLERPASAPLIRSGELPSSSEGTPSEHVSEPLIPIYQTRDAQETSNQLKTSIWYQWVASHADITYSTDNMKLLLHLDDALLTLDLQESYEHFRFKLASATICHFKRDPEDDSWVRGEGVGKVMTTRKGPDGKSVSSILCTILRTHGPEVPKGWRDEYTARPRCGQRPEASWEVSVRTAPVQLMLHPRVIEELALIARTLLLCPFCPVPLTKNAEPAAMPLCHLHLGGARVVLFTSERDEVQDDTLIIDIGVIKTRPQPQNPICRRSISSLGEAHWVPVASACDGRQHEIVMGGVGVSTTRIEEMLAQVAYSTNNGMSEVRTRRARSTNPAVEWRTPVPPLRTTPILHIVDVHGVFAPPLFSGGSLACGPALELNVPADVVVEISAEQMAFLARLVPAIYRACTERTDESETTFDHPTWCPLSTEFVFDEEPVEEEYPDENMDGVVDPGFDPQPSSSRMDPPPEEMELIPRPSPTQMISVWEYMELFMVIGRVDVAFYVRYDADSYALTKLRKSQRPLDKEHESGAVKIVIQHGEQNVQEPEQDSASGSKSLTENVREADVGRSRLDIFEELQFARSSCADFIPVMHATLHQPNLYYWRKKDVKGLQMSLFNLWVAHGEGQDTEEWHSPLLTTREGSCDPETEIPNSLASLNCNTLPGTSSERDIWSVRIDIDRPVSMYLGCDSIERLHIFATMIACALTGDATLVTLPESEKVVMNELYTLLERTGIEQVTVRTDQVSATTDGVSAGWDELSAQLTCTHRPPRLTARVLLTAFTTLTCDPLDESIRHILVEPVNLGLQAEMVWPPLLADDSVLSIEPTVRVSVELSDLNVDLRPSDVSSINQMLYNFSDEVAFTLKYEQAVNAQKRVSEESVTSDEEKEKNDDPWPPEWSPANVVLDMSYKDDLRSGAFKILSGAEARTPLPYEVSLRDSTVVWHYPAPRSITRLIVAPLPVCSEEAECVLESLNQVVGRWERHLYFKIPQTESREYRISKLHVDKVFANMWRVRLVSSEEKQPAPFMFNREKYLPREQPGVQFGVNVDEDACVSANASASACDSAGVSAGTSAGRLSAEQLVGALRVNSFTGRRFLPRLHLSVRCGALALHVHNKPPEPGDAGQSKNMPFEGVYVSSEQQRGHRVLSVVMRDVVLYANKSRINKMLAVEGMVGVDMFESETGTMEPLIGDCRLQALVNCGLMLRARLCTGDIRIHLNGPRVRTLTTILDSWESVYENYISSEIKLRKYKDPKGKMIISELPQRSPRCKEVKLPLKLPFREDLKRLESACESLDGRVYFYVVNTCEVTLRLGQEGTDEIILFGSNVTLAYRWKSPLAPKKLRFSKVDANNDWHWSNSIPFTEGMHKVRLEEPVEAATGVSKRDATYLYVRVKDQGGRMKMYVNGRVLLGNMLTEPISYKMHVRDPAADSTDGLRVVASGDLVPESVGLTLFNMNVESKFYMKIRLGSRDSGWTGEIPVKVGPKIKIPWMVKVPLLAGETPFVSLWCRVERTCKDERVSVIFFPMFMMRSHLPLEVNVLVTTEQIEPDSDSGDELVSPPLTQLVPGRGTISQILIRGTTSSKHVLIFRYRDADCEVTREPVAMSYSLAEAPGFEKYSPPEYTDEILDEAMGWLNSATGVDVWPYSVVRTHLPGEWEGTTMQPRCDIMVRYTSVECGGSTCSMVTELFPCAMLVNASGVTVEVRGADAAPFCRVESHQVVSLPSVVVEKPFYVTIQERHETFLSNALSVSAENPGVYGRLRTGQVGVDTPTSVAVRCNDKVVLMTLHYSIYREVNVFGLTAAFIFMNKLPFCIYVAPVILQNARRRPPVLRPRDYQEISPIGRKSCGLLNAKTITEFTLVGPWCDDIDELCTFMCVGFNNVHDGNNVGVPVRVGVSAMRRSIALRNDHNESVPVVVTQVQHEGRWVVSVGLDPSPQFIVYNHTNDQLTIGQPLRAPSDQQNPNEELPEYPECKGCKWSMVVQPHGYTYYSTPTYLVDTTNNSKAARATYLFAGRLLGEFTPDWGVPFMVKEGLQLVQLPRQFSLKVRITTNPHSTTVELLSVDERDLIVREIRRRLEESCHHNPFYPQDEMDEDNLSVATDRRSRQRAVANKPVLARNKTYRGVSVVALPRSEEKAPETPSTVTLAQMDLDSETSLPLVDSDPTLENFSDVGAHVTEYEYDMAGAVMMSDWLRFRAHSVTVELAHGLSHVPLVRATADRVALMLRDDGQSHHTVLSVGDVQVDNPQYSSREFDFPVVATTGTVPREPERFPALWGMMLADHHFNSRPRGSSVYVDIVHERWTIGGEEFQSGIVPIHLRELRDIDIFLGPVSLYVEDLYIRRVTELLELLAMRPAKTPERLALSEAASLHYPMRIHRLRVHPLDITFTLHTAMRLYVGVDQTPLRLSAFKLFNAVTTSNRLSHDLTIHYLSGLILGAGWVVGGLEMLGAPCSLASRLSNARGGLRDVVAVAGAAVLRSMNSCAGSLARNLDLLAGDDEHTQRAALARREIPPTFLAGLFAGMQNFAVNILGAVGGLAHHPLVGMTVGETSGVTALRRGLVGAVAKPLSATADLVAFAGQGLLTQTGWDPDPQQRPTPLTIAVDAWRRDNVRWTFRLQMLRVLYGTEAEMDGTIVRLVVTDKFLVVAEPSTERIVEMLDFRFCTLVSYNEQDVELRVKLNGSRSDTRESFGAGSTFRINSAAMARVARYTGARHVCEGRGMRVHTVRNGPALAAALYVAIRHNQQTYFSLF